MPLKLAGTRIEPPPSVPMCKAPMPSAQAAAAPPLEPPGVFARSHGLRVMPVSGLSVTAFQPNSGVVVLPISTAPCSRSRAVAGASWSQAWSRATARLPRSVGHPSVSTRSLIVAGTPSTRPAGAPRRQRSSEARALSSARSGSTTQNALTAPSKRSMRSSTARVASTGESVLRR